MEKSKIPDVIRVEDDAIFVDFFRSFVLEYVLNTYNPGSSGIIGATPAEKYIPFDFAKQTTVEDILAKAQEILGEPVPQKSVEAFKNAASDKINKEYGRH